MATRLYKAIFAVCLIFCFADAIPVKESVSATVGAPWPQPKSMKQTSSIYPVAADSFMFMATGSSCDILEAAFNRYRFITFGLDLKDHKLRFHPRGSLAVGVVSSLSVGVKTPCQGDYPSLQSDESYQLVINANGATLTANQVWGALRGLETFSQLVVRQITGEFVIQDTDIDDAPRFAHRGMLLDTSRHFLSVDVILRNLDALAQNKYNVFHWHIVDDQSFPYESSKFPEMSDMGAYSESHVYTQSDVKTVVEYARLRGIRVMPEYDSPGHSQSWGKAIKGLLTPCYSKGQPDGTFGPINPVPESTYTFLQQFFGEVASVFPDHYLHMGGDEVSFQCWMSNPDISKFMVKMNYTTYAQLEQYYMERLLTIVNGLGKGYQIWQEVVDNGAKVRRDTVVEVWKSHWQTEMANMTRLGYHTLLSTCWYLNYISYGSDWVTYYKCDPHNFNGNHCPEVRPDTVVEVWKGGWQAEIGRVTKLGYQSLLASPWYLNYISYGSDWIRYYNVEPTSFNGTAAQKALVMGGETAMWGEYVDDTNVLSRVWPRAASVGERLWSPQSVNSTQLALPRLIEHRCRMVRRGFPAEPVSGPGFCDVEYVS